MKRETISQGVSNISDRYIEEAANYICEKKSEKKSGKPSQKKHTGWFRGAFIKNVVAAILVLVVLAYGIAVLFSSHDAVITVYAYGTNEEITAAGAILNTGRISDTGEMKGKPLMFYLIGTDIATVRFSCKNQQLYFMDWTEKRDEYGSARNFTVVYGEDESEYYYLTIDWVPDAAIRELTDNADSRIASLPDELREDIIVMEITFGNGKKVTKAVMVSLQDDGTFLASCDDYEIKDSDTFIKRLDSEAVPRDILYGETADSMTQEENNTQTKELEGVSLTAEQIEKAKQAALAYYEGTVFSVNTIEYFEGKLSYGGDMDGDCHFTVNVSKGGVVQEPDRTITLRMEQGEWKVVNEGY